MSTHERDFRPPPPARQPTPWWTDLLNGTPGLQGSPEQLQAIADVTLEAGRIHRTDPLLTPEHCYELATEWILFNRQLDWAAFYQQLRTIRTPA